jgi:hypothetical protein
MINVLPHSDNKVEEVHFNMALLFIGNGSALCYKDKNMIRTKEQYEKLVIEPVVEEEKKKKEYEQLEFEFDEDLVAPI